MTRRRARCRHHNGRPVIPGEFEHLVMLRDATKEVEVRARDLAKAADSLVGVALMRQAFSPNGPGPLAGTNADKGEQSG